MLSDFGKDGIQWTVREVVPFTPKFKQGVALQHEREWLKHILQVYFQEDSSPHH